MRFFDTYLKPDKESLPRLWRYSKAFFLDHWPDLLCIFLITAIAGAVWLLSFHPLTTYLY